MLLEPLPKWRRLAIAFGIVIVLLVVTGGVFVWSGFYNVAATREHFGVTTWLLQKVREQSVATQSAFVELPPLDHPALWRLGAAHYEGACAPCHGRPGEDIPEIVSNMLPPPPDLAEAVEGQSEEEIFWIVKHGLKYTGMPAWPSQQRDDEVEAVTAFLMRLPQRLPDEAYDTLSGAGRLPPPEQWDRANPALGTETEALTQCLRCHDGQRRATLAETVPRLSGQSEAYLRRALLEYRSGDRPSGIMQPVADLLNDAEVAELAAHYAALPAANGDRRLNPDNGRLQRGLRLAQAGDPAAGIPPCLACHGSGRSPGFPDIAGQHAVYLAGQLRLFAKDAREGTAWGRIMTAVARQMDESQMLDAAAYFSSLDAAPPASAASPEISRRLSAQETDG